MPVDYHDYQDGNLFAIAYPAQDQWYDFDYIYASIPGA